MNLSGSAEANAPVPPAPEDMDTDPMVELGQLSYRQLIWRRFRKSRLGLVAGAILIIFYIIAIGARF